MHMCNGNDEDHDDEDDHDDDDDGDHIAEINITIPNVNIKNWKT